MRKITCFLMAALSVACLSGVAQTKADIGWDWDGSKAIESTSGIYFSSSENVANQGLENEILVSCIGNARFGNTGGGLYGPKNGPVYEYLEVITDQSDFIEVSLTDNSNGKIITGFKLNGTSASTTAGSTVSIIYSSQSPFDVNNCIGYTTCPLGFCRAGDAGTSITDIPADCKSFRIGRKVLLSESEGKYSIDEFGDIAIGGGGNSRIGYVAVTLSEGSSSIPTINSEGRIILSTEYFDVTGKKANEDAKGFIIKKTTYEGGAYDSQKIFNN